jgi:hypothetical protein
MGIGAYKTCREIGRQEKKNQIKNVDEDFFTAKQQVVVEDPEPSPPHFLVF